MGVKQTKKPTASPGSGPHLKKVKGENFYRDAKSARRAKLLTSGHAIRNSQGKIIQSAPFQRTEAETEPGRVGADKRWFGNTRVIGQEAMQHFREALQGKVGDPYSVVLNRGKLPLGLLRSDANPGTSQRPKIVDVEPFKDTFGPKAQRKRAHVDVGSFEELAAAAAPPAEPAEGEAVAESSTGASTSRPAQQPEADEDGYKNAPSHPLFSKGTSRRIHGELHKVIDSSDVLLHVLDARDPKGTMCEAVLEFMKKEKAHKQIVFVLNKCDLVPGWVAARWLKHLTTLAPTIAFHASLHHSFGKGTLIALLRQFQNLHSDRKQISVGFIGYPNVGKSSIINCLKKGKVCTVAPIPGETKVWQYITLTKKIYLIDCPGIVPVSKNDSETDTVLKGVIRLSALPNPSEYIPELLGRVRPEYLGRTYGVPASWTWGAQGELEGVPIPVEVAEKWLEKLARKTGKLLKGGEADRETVARMVLGDWQRGRVPFYVRPPEVEGREGKGKAAASAGAVPEKAVIAEGEGQTGQIAQGEADAPAQSVEDAAQPSDPEPAQAHPKKTKKDKKKERELLVHQDIRVLRFPNGTKWLEVDERRAEEEREDEAVVRAEGSEVDDEENDDAEEDEEDEEDDDDQDDEEEDGEEGDDTEDGVEDEEHGLTWEEALGTVIGPTGALRQPESSQQASTSKSRKRPSQGGPVDGSEDERPKKAPRMTTNKKKAENFFTTANVKNRNRKREMPKEGGKRKGGRR